MKQRLISIAVGLVLLAGIILLFGTVATPIAFVLIGILAIFELTRALGLNDNLLFFALYSLAHASNIFFRPDGMYFTYALLFITVCLVMFCQKRHYTFKEGAAAMAGVVMISYGLRSIIEIEAMAWTTGDARFMFIMGLCLGWVCDTFAYCFGRAFGKRKLCPTISPNKTVAGAVGGVVGTPVVIAAAFTVYALNCAPDSMFYGKTGLMHIAFYAAMGLLGAIIGIIGDLAASYIKRECNIKDFGNIMPGHGGAIDRLDSVLFTCIFASLCYGLFLQFF